MMLILQHQSEMAEVLFLSAAYDKRKIRGLIHDQSASGKTVFIEPEEIVEINNDLIELEYEEKREIVRILTAFADDIRPYIDELLEVNSFLGEIDFIRAKALLGNHLQFNKTGNDQQAFHFLEKSCSSSS